MRPANLAGRFALHGRPARELAARQGAGRLVRDRDRRRIRGQLDDLRAYRRPLTAAEIRGELKRPA
jgi:hypothetical protein